MLISLNILFWTCVNWERNGNLRHFVEFNVNLWSES